MIDARHYAIRDTLKNGLDICIRASHPDDVDQVIDAFQALDKESVYLRFFGPKKEISQAELQRFREVDFDRRVVLLCIAQREAQDVVIASCSYVRVGEDEAEVAFLVGDNYHRLGIAGRMLKSLGEIARSAGVRRFIAEVLPRNKAILGVFGRCGWPMRSQVADGVVHVYLELQGDDA